MHCVTRWSRFDNRFQASLTDVHETRDAKAEARFAILRGEHGYTTNLPLADLMMPKRFLPQGTTVNRSPPITVILSGLVVPHCICGKA